MPMVVVQYEKASGVVKKFLHLSAKAAQRMRAKNQAWIDKLVMFEGADALLVIDNVNNLADAEERDYRINDRGELERRT